MEISEFTGDGMSVIKTTHSPGDPCGFAYRRRRIDVTISGRDGPHSHRAQPAALRPALDVAGGRHGEQPHGRQDDRPVRAFPLHIITGTKGGHAG